MKLMKAFFVVACLLTMVAGGFAQNTETQKKPVFGYMNPKTGVFHSLSRPALSADAAAAIVPSTGTFVFSVTIAVSSALPTTATIGCSVFGGVEDTTSGGYENDASTTAKRAGNTATCTLTLPYSWDLANAAKDTVEFDLEVSASSGTIGSDDYYTEDFVAPAVTSKVPSNGTTTTEKISTTI